MRAFYKDGDKNRICMVCDTINQPLAGVCKKCEISFMSHTTQQKIVKMHNDIFLDSAVEDILLGETLYGED